MARPRNSTKTSLSQTIDFWNGENVFRESTQNIGTSFLDTSRDVGKQIKDFSESLRASLKAKEDDWVKELSSRHDLTLEETVDQNLTFEEIVEQSDKKYDESKFVSKGVVLGSHGNMEQAYKAAYEELLKKTHKMETQAVNFIEKLKQERVDFKESIQLNTASVVKKVHEQSLHIVEEELNSTTNFSPNSKDTKTVKFLLEFPPPEYFELSQRCPASLLNFLNEDFHDYCEDVRLCSLSDRCYMIRKIFKGECQESENFREKVKVFLSLDQIVRHVFENTMSEEDLYLNLVQFLYNKSPSTDLTTRQTGQSWLVYFNKQLRLKYYMDKSLNESELVRSVIKSLTESPELLNASREVLLKFDKKFRINLMVGNHISKSELIAFAMEVDAFYSDSELNERSLSSAPLDFSS